LPMQLSRRTVADEKELVYVCRRMPAIKLFPILANNRPAGFGECLTKFVGIWQGRIKPGNPPKGVLIEKAVVGEYAFHIDDQSKGLGFLHESLKHADAFTQHL